MTDLPEAQAAVPAPRGRDLMPRLRGGAPWLQLALAALVVLAAVAAAGAWAHSGVPFFVPVWPLAALAVLVVLRIRGRRQRARR